MDITDHRLYDVTVSQKSFTHLTCYNFDIDKQILIILEEMLLIK